MIEIKALEKIEHTEEESLLLYPLYTWKKKRRSHYLVKSGYLVVSVAECERRRRCSGRSVEVKQKRKLHTEKETLGLI